MLYRDSRLRETTTKSGLGPTFTVTSSVELWTSTRGLRNFRGCHPCKLKCYIGIVGFERRQQSRVLDRPLQLLVQLSFGLRRENLEIFVDAFHATINEQLIQIYNSLFCCRLKCYIGIVGFEGRQQSRVLYRPLQLLVQLSFGLRRENLEIFADAIHGSINEQLIQIYNSLFCCRLKCYIGIVGFEGRQQSRVLDRPLQLLVELSFGLRRENLEIFADAIHASINEHRLRGTTTKSGLGPTFTVTSSVELWTSTRELRNFRGCHPCKLKCRVGILAFERRRLCRVLDLPLKLLVQLSFGLRQENLEIFVDAFHASINEQLIQTYYGIFGFRLKCRVGILGFERRRRSRVMDRPLQLLVKLCCGLRRENLEIFADAIHAIGFERRQQSRVLDRPLQLLVQLSFGLRRENLEIFADAIHASINEQLIQIYNSLFCCRLKCYIGIVGFEGREQSRVLDRPLQLLVQLSFGLRQENLEIFADAIHASINEQLIQIYNSLFCCRLKCYIGIVGFEGRQQSRVLDRPLQLLVQLSFGLRRENLEIFVDAIHASTNE
ncbi:hypothetical protein V1477_013464 [Vespula maculifrons]|uniref:Uncharacterized protein n=1 Tax=Vespula maculifrons TaxID=7453 RepID=A0ABD2BQ86_VESMC